MGATPNQRLSAKHAISNLFIKWLDEEQSLLAKSGYRPDLEELAQVHAAYRVSAGWIGIHYRAGAKAAILNRKASESGEAESRIKAEIASSSTMSSLKQQEELAEVEQAKSKLQLLATEQQNNFVKAVEDYAKSLKLRKSDPEVRRIHAGNRFEAGIMRAFDEAAGGMKKGKIQF